MEDNPMCGTQKVRDLFADNMCDKIETWGMDQIEMDNENYIEGLLTQDEMIARSEVRESCSSFMLELFSDMVDNIKMEVAK